MAKASSRASRLTSLTNKTRTDFRVASALVGACRFCDAVTRNVPSSVGRVCAAAECVQRASNACTKILTCGHTCGGVKDETRCPPCLHDCAQSAGSKVAVFRANGPMRRKREEQMCSICLTDKLLAAPVLQLECGHVYHYHCCETMLRKRWSGPRISFGFIMCPLCESKWIRHERLSKILKPLEELHNDVQRKATTRLQYENLHHCADITTPGRPFYQKPVEFAMQRYTYYLCSKCNKAYYGGQARCAEQAVLSDDYKPAELVCAGCSHSAGKVSCRHGTDYIAHKCRYCCSIAVFFCFGTTHFCTVCHNEHVRVVQMGTGNRPQCPVGPGCKQLSGTVCPLQVKHPPTGQEFVLGCAMCRDEQSF